MWTFVALSFSWSLVANLQAWCIKGILNHVEAKHLSEVVVYMGYYLALTVAFVLIFFMLDWTLARFQPEHKQQSYLYLLDQLLLKDTEFYQKYASGNLSTKLQDIVQNIPDMLFTLSDDLLKGFFLFLIGLINIGLVDPFLSSIIFVWFAIFLGLSLFFSKSYRGFVSENAEKKAQVAAHMMDCLFNISSIRLFARRNSEVRYFGKTVQKATHAEKRLNFFVTKIHLFQGVGLIFLQGFVFTSLYKGLKDHKVSAGDFALVVTMMRQIFYQFWNISKRLRYFWVQLGTLEQAFKVVHAPAQIENQVQASQTSLPELHIKKGEITFDRVKFLYHQEDPLFENSSVTIEGKQHVGLVGFSGSGKSTFVNLILRLFDIHSGCISIDKQDISKVSITSLRKAISVIPQDPALFQRSIFENIRFGNPDASEEAVIEAAKKALVHDFVQPLPQGYDTPVGERGASLSGGQKQRIAIARALLKNSPILILDEVTSQLDAIIESQVQHSLGELMKGKTALIIAHRLSTLSKVDRILVFDKGNIVQDGTHRELIQQKGIYKALWKHQRENPISPPEDKSSRPNLWG